MNQTSQERKQRGSGGKPEQIEQAGTRLSQTRCETSIHQHKTKLEHIRVSGNLQLRNGWPFRICFDTITNGWIF